MDPSKLASMVPEATNRGDKEGGEVSEIADETCDVKSHACRGYKWLRNHEVGNKKEAAT